MLSSGHPETEISYQSRNVIHLSGVSRLPGQDNRVRTT